MDSPSVSQIREWIALFLLNLFEEESFGHYSTESHSLETPDQCESSPPVKVTPMSQTLGISRNERMRQKRLGKRIRDCLKTCRLMTFKSISNAIKEGRIQTPPGGIYNALPYLYEGNNIIRTTKPDPKNPSTKGIEDENGHVMLDEEGAKEAVEYINSALEFGLPVNIGVSYIHPSKRDPHADGVTDHIILIYGRDCDPEGHVLYYAIDPGRGFGHQYVTLFLTRGGLLIKPPEIEIGEPGQNTRRGYEVSYVVKYTFEISPNTTRVADL